MHYYPKKNIITAKKKHIVINDFFFNTYVIRLHDSNGQSNVKFKIKNKKQQKIFFHKFNLKKCQSYIHKEFHI